MQYRCNDSVFNTTTSKEREYSLKNHEITRTRIVIVISLANKVTFTLYSSEIYLILSTSENQAKLDSCFILVWAPTVV